MQRAATHHFCSLSSVNDAHFVYQQPFGKSKEPTFDKSGHTLQIFQNGNHQIHLVKFQFRVWFLDVFWQDPWRKKCVFNKNVSPSKSQIDRSPSGPPHVTHAALSSTYIQNLRKNSWQSLLFVWTSGPRRIHVDFTCE